VIDLSISTFLITLINIGLLFVVLRAILFKRVTKFMEDRSSKIRLNIEEAEKDKQAAKNLASQWEERLKNVQGEADELLRAAREKARQEADRIVAEGRETANALILNARQQIETDLQGAAARFHAEAATLVIAAAGRLLQRDLSQEDNRAFAGMLLQELGKR
jgi:F-type H+-transporting ATPase subunit b